MSADNGIYILKSKDGYRVTYAQAIENLFEPDEPSPLVRAAYQSEKINPEEALAFFGESPVLSSEEQAVLYAWELSKQYEYLEYGISFVGVLEDFPNTQNEEIQVLEDTIAYICCEEDSFRPEHFQLSQLLRILDKYGSHTLACHATNTKECICGWGKLKERASRTLPHWTAD